MLQFIQDGPEFCGLALGELLRMVDITFEEMYSSRRRGGEPRWLDITIITGLYSDGLIRVLIPQHIAKFVLGKVMQVMPLRKKTICVIVHSQTVRYFVYFSCFRSTEFVFYGLPLCTQIAFVKAWLPIYGSNRSLFEKNSTVESRLEICQFPQGRFWGQKQLEIFLSIHIGWEGFVFYK